MDPKRIAGPVKAAILIHALGRPQVETLVRRLSANEKELVNDHLSQIRTISPDVVEQVAREFIDIARRYKSKPAENSQGKDSGSGESDASMSMTNTCRQPGQQKV